MGKMFEFKGLNNFRNSIEGRKASIEKRANAAFREYVADVLTELSLNTPQWSGDLAASWRVKAQGSSGTRSVRTAGYYGQTPFKQNPYDSPAPFRKGSMPAVDYALARNTDVINTIYYNTRVTIYNDNPTGDTITESGLRPGNFIPGDIMAIAHVTYKFRIAGAGTWN
jgi:hypothetical protein